MDGERCETCKFWQQSEDGTGDRKGWCRRYPPTVNHAYPIIHGIVGVQIKDRDPTGSAYMEGYAQFPMIDAEDWCGEFRPRTPLPVVAPG
jgi:hypothetical protein